MRCLALALSLGFLLVLPVSAFCVDVVTVDDFQRDDAWYHGDAWETLTPGNWKVENKALRWRLENNGNANPITSFPWHWSSGGKTIPPRTRDLLPDLPPGLIWNREWQLTGNFTLVGEFKVHNIKPEGRGEKSGYFGVCFGGESLYETRNFRGAKPNSGAASWMAVMDREGEVSLLDHTNNKPVKGTTAKKLSLENNDPVEIAVIVSGPLDKPATVKIIALCQGETQQIELKNVDRKKFTQGYFGLVGYGAIDFEVSKISLIPNENKIAKTKLNDLHICYPLGDTLQKENDTWQCKFVSLFRSPGETVELRIADSENPPGGWENVPAAGSAKIVDNDWRRYTSIINATLPANPADKTFFYTIWKDGKNVTADPRPANEEEGYLGAKKYVGRLPQLKAPYRVCTLGGHALTGGGTTLPQSGTYQKNWIHGQPTQNAYKHFEDYDFQIINWDDDVWYLELLFPPPSTDDAYKVITLTIANPTSRWQMMRHWNIINPGDHDYGMDDIKGPEQLLVRQRDDLGQDSEYMRRNFDINHHLVQGLEHRVGDINPKDWRLWRMPNEDFSILVAEARLWRTSQDTNIWVNGGWGDKRALYSRTDPTRTLLGEEQFAWFKEVIQNETSPLICITGINCMHPVFTGKLIEPTTGLMFASEDRVAADYAGWVTAGTDRVLEVLGSRSGIVSVYGDIHLASIVENKFHRIIESSCGPIGRGGSRGLKEDWAPEMKDYDGRDVKIHALYHLQYDTPQLRKNEGPPHWNFLEKEFDPRGKDPTITMQLRNLIDPPHAEVRGGGKINRSVSSTGRKPSSKIQSIKTLPNAAIHFRTLDGRPIRGIRSLPDGTVPVESLIDIQPGTKVLVTANDGENAEAKVIVTQELK